MSEHLNYSGDRAFSDYITGIANARAYLAENDIDTNRVNLPAFFESYAKRFLAAGMGDYALWELFHRDVNRALNPELDSYGNIIFTNTQAPSVTEILEWHDLYDYQNGNYSTTAFTDNTFDPETYFLQVKLNESGATDKFGDRLVEDGVYGPNTQWVSDLAKGIMPSMSLISPLPKNMPISLDASKLHSMIMDEGYTKVNPKGNPVFRFHDGHPYKGKPVSYHINTLDFPQIQSSALNPIQKWTLNKLSHLEVPKPIYDTFRDFDNLTKIAKNGGKALAAVGTVLDVYELGSTIYHDLNNEDGKLGKDTLQTSVGIGGSYAGGIGGAKLGAMGGASFGTLICPGLGTVIGGFFGGVSGGIAGSFGGRWLGEEIVEFSYGGE